MPMTKEQTQQLIDGALAQGSLPLRGMRDPRDLVVDAIVATIMQLADRVTLDPPAKASATPPAPPPPPPPPNV